MRITFMLMAALLAGNIQAREILVMDWNGISYENDAAGHIPHENPPRAAANGNWHSPVNYAEGTLHFRMEVRSMPVPKEIYPMFCVWQQGTDPDKTDFGHEECVPYSGLVGVTGTRGNVKTWTYPLASMKPSPGKLGQFLHIDYTRPRQQYGYGIKCAYGGSYQLVSNIKGYDWSGQDPAEWYPLDHRMTVVIVEKGGTFSGWHNYVYSEYTDAPSFSPEPGTYEGVAEITITSTTPGAQIYYTTDGTDPSEKSLRYTGLLTLAKSGKLKAKAYSSGREPSLITATDRYVISSTGGTVSYVEAEAMALDGFAAAGQSIRLPDGTATGTARSVFDGEAGSYIISLVAIPENDGQSTLVLSVNGAPVLEERLPMHEDYAAGTIRQFVSVSGVSLSPGDTLTVTGTADARAVAKLDKIKLAAETVSSVTGVPAPMVQPAACMPSPMTDRVSFLIPGTAAGVSVSILDMYGNVVTRISGLNWDGRDGRGHQCGPGLYSFIIRDGADRYGGTFLKTE